MQRYIDNINVLWQFLERIIGEMMGSLTILLNYTFTAFNDASNSSVYIVYK
jgi:hypothetical protein